MQSVWHHGVSHALRFFSLVIVISLVALPVSISDAKIAGLQIADMQKTEPAGASSAAHCATTEPLLKNFADSLNMALGADCAHKSTIDADNSWACCSTFSFAFYVSDTYVLGTIFGANAIAPMLERQLASGKSDAPHRPPNSRH